jgi:hypothetical protein
MNTADVSKVISIVQLSQMAVALIGAIRDAVLAGKDGVDESELAEAFAEKDTDLLKLAESITRAKAQGR